MQLQALGVSNTEGRKWTYIFDADTMLPQSIKKIFIALNGMNYNAKATVINLTNNDISNPNSVARGLKNY
jgi:hypothetical protein